METLLAAIEQWPLTRVLKTAFIAYPLVSATHVLAIGTLVSSVALMHLRIAGFAEALPEAAFVRLLRRVAIGAFALAALSGFLLFTVRARDYAASPLFLSKMAIIVLAIVNFLVFVAIEARRPRDRPRPAAFKLMSVASVGLWLAVMLCGRFLGFA